jgi:5-methylcytosine-specific restriction endonuclease McrA
MKYVLPLPKPFYDGSSVNAAELALAVGMSKSSAYRFFKKHPCITAKKAIEYYSDTYGWFSTKTCPSCCKKLPIDEFRVGKTRSASCRECRATKKRQRYKTDEEYREKLQKANRERLRFKYQSDKEYREKAKAKWRDRYHENPKPFLEKRKKWKQENPRMVKEGREKWKQENPDYAYNWWRENRVKARWYSSKRRTMERGGDANDLSALIDAKRCYWCGCELKGKYHLDHVVPLSKGGRHIVANLVASCPTCNLSKGAKMPNDWIEQGQLILELT